MKRWGWPCAMTVWSLYPVKCCGEFYVSVVSLWTVHKEMSLHLWLKQCLFRWLSLCTHESVWSCGSCGLPWQEAGDQWNTAGIKLYSFDEILVLESEMKLKCIITEVFFSLCNYGIGIFMLYKDVHVIINFIHMIRIFLLLIGSPGISFHINLHREMYVHTKPSDTF